MIEKTSAHVRRTVLRGGVRRSGRNCRTPLFRIGLLLGKQRLNRLQAAAKPMLDDRISAMLGLSPWQNWPLAEYAPDHCSEY
jgi:hypothetical protein